MIAHYKQIAKSVCRNIVLALSFILTFFACSLFALKLKGPIHSNVLGIAISKLISHYLDDDGINVVSKQAKLEYSNNLLEIEFEEIMANINGRLMHVPNLILSVDLSKILDSRQSSLTITIENESVNLRQMLAYTTSDTKKHPSGKVPTLQGKKRRLVSILRFLHKIDLSNIQFYIPIWVNGTEQNLELSLDNIVLEEVDAVADVKTKIKIGQTTSDLKISLNMEDSTAFYRDESQVLFLSGQLSDLSYESLKPSFLPRDFRFASLLNNIKFSGDLKFHLYLDSGSHLKQLELILNSSQLQVSPSTKDKPLYISLSGAGLYDIQEHSITITGIQYKDNLNSSIKGRIFYDLDKNSSSFIELFLEKPMPIERVYFYWPALYGKVARQWLTKNLRVATINSGNLAFKISKDYKFESVNANFDLTNATLRYEYPQVSQNNSESEQETPYGHNIHIDAANILFDQKNLNAKIKSAQTEGLDLTDFEIKIFNPIKDPLLELSGNVVGPLTTFIGALQRHIPYDINTNHTIPYLNLLREGKGKVNLAIKIAKSLLGPSQASNVVHNSQIPKKAEEIELEGKIQNIRIDNLKDHTLESSALFVKYKDEIISIDGFCKIDDSVDMDLGIQERVILSDKMADKNPLKISIKFKDVNFAKAISLFRKKTGLEGLLESYLASGNIEAYDVAGGEAKIGASLKLSEVPGMTRLIGDNLTLNLEALLKNKLKDSSNVTIDYSLQGETIYSKGSVSYENSEINLIRPNKIKDMPQISSTIEEDRKKIVLKGDILDLSKFHLNNQHWKVLDFSVSGKSDNTNSATTSSIDFESTFSKIILPGSHVLMDAVIHVNCIGSRCTKAYVEGYWEKKGGYFIAYYNFPVFSIASNNAGETLDALHLYHNMRLGKLELKGQIQSDKSVEGVLSIEKFDVIEAPVLGQLLKLTSLTSINFASLGDLLKVGRLSFNAFQCPSRYKDKQLTFDRCKLGGHTVDITSRGTVDFETKKVSISGYISPRNIFTTIRAILKSLFSKKTTAQEERASNSAVNFRIHGELDKKLGVKTNPLVLLNSG